MTHVSRHQYVFLSASDFVEKPVNWKRHTLYKGFVTKLQTDYCDQCPENKRRLESYLQCLLHATDSYVLFSVYLKIIADLGESIKDFNFAFRDQEKCTKCVVDVYYSNGFLQTLAVNETNPDTDMKNTSNSNLKT